MELISRQECYNKFIEWRGKLNRAQENYASDKGFLVLFNEALNLAREGDAAMQDVVAYFYKSGVDRLLSEDYLKYMKWEILAGANGNEFAIEKLQFFLGYAYDQIVASAEFPKIKYYNNINEYNYISIIGQKLCEALVKKLDISADILTKTRDIFQPYRPEYFRDLRRAVDEVIPLVIDEMKTAR